MRKDTQKGIVAPDGIEIYLEVLLGGFQSSINVTSGIVMAAEEGVRCGE